MYYTCLLSVLLFKFSFTSHLAILCRREPLLQPVSEESEAGSDVTIDDEEESPEP